MTANHVGHEIVTFPGSPGRRGLEGAKFDGQVRRSERSPVRGFPPRGARRLFVCSRLLYVQFKGATSLKVKVPKGIPSRLCWQP